MNINNKYSGFEKMLKDKFSNFESPYNHKDWEDFKKDLPKSNHHIFSSKNILKFFIIASAIVIPIIATLLYNSKNSNKKETTSIDKKINQQENANHDQDNNIISNHLRNNIANNNKSNTPKTFLNSGNTSLSTPISKKTDDQKMNNKNNSIENPVVNAPVKNNSKVSSSNSFQFNDDFISADVIEGCAPLKVQFSPSIASDTISYLWTFDDGKLSAISSPAHVFDKAGSYNVSLSVTFVKSNITRKIHYSNVINVKDIPTARFDYSFDTQSDVISFTDNSLGAVSWLWSFGDNTISTDSIPQHEYKQNGIYNVQLTVKSGSGCTDTYSSNITVKLKDFYFIPNAFSPNGDGKDDYFGPIGSNLNPDGYYFIIYNKNGKSVFETNDIDFKWDGKIKGTNNAAQPDIYFWRIKMKDKNGVFQERSGYVTLIK
jgi:gliding motility-associated-like protein